MFGNESYRRSITGAFDHVLVDEYQDVNPGQIALLDHFVRDGVGLWAVGDDDQTLYAFRASDIRYILEFEDRHPGATVHILERNYRSAPEIVAVAKRLIRNNASRIDKDYQPAVTEPGEIVIRGYGAPESEARQVARAVAELIASGTEPQEIAVLYRSGAIGLAFQTVLQELGIPFEVRGGADVWQSVAARLVVGALVYLRDGPTSAALSRLGSNTRAEIVRADLDLVRKVVAGDLPLSCQHVERIVGGAVPKRASERETAEWQAIVAAVITLARSCVSLDELEVRIVEQSRALREPPQRAVALSTIHSAKGLEWATVFLVGMESGVLPHINSEDIEEERRVAYVGLTRARNRLGMTYSATRYGERARPSPFLSEIAGKQRQYCTWTGPAAEGADDRLPLRAPDETALQSAVPAATDQTGKVLPAEASLESPRRKRKHRENPKRRQTSGGSRQARDAD